MSKVALPRVAAILAERHERVTSDLDKAAKLKAETDQAIATYEKALADARANAQKIAAETQASLSAETETKRKALEAELHGKLESRHKIYKLRDALIELADEYDTIWIDTPPALNFYTQSALIAAQGCLIPFDCDDFSRRALYGLLESVKEIQADHNPDLVVEGIVVNQFQPRASLPQRTVQELIDEGLPVLQPYLGASVKIKESHELSCPMIHLDPRHKLTQSFEALYDALS